MIEENREYLEDVFSEAESMSLVDQITFLEEVLADFKNKQKDGYRKKGSVLELPDAMWEVEERILHIKRRLLGLEKLKTFGPNRGKRRNAFKRRQQLVVEILLERREDGTFVRRPVWSSQVPNDLFIAVEEFEEELNGDPPGNSAERYFQRRLGGKFPGAGNMEGWFALAEKWADTG